MADRGPNQTQTDRYEVQDALPFRKLTFEECKAWWLERFTHDEIVAMAAGIERVLA